MRLASGPLSTATVVFTILTCIFPVVLSDSFRNGGNFPHVMRHIHPAMERRYTSDSSGSYPLPSASGPPSGVKATGSFPTGIGTASGASASASMGFPGTNASTLASTLGYSRTSKYVTTSTIYKLANPTGSPPLGQGTGESTPTKRPGSQGSSGGEPSGAGAQGQQSPGTVSPGGAEVVQIVQPQDKHVQATVTLTSNSGAASSAQPVSNSGSNSGSDSGPGSEPNPDHSLPGGTGESCPPQGTVTVTAQSTFTVTVTATPSPDRPMSESGSHGAGAGASTRTTYSSGFVPSGVSTGLFPSGTGYLGGVQNGTYVRHRV